MLRILPNGAFARRDLVLAVDSAERGICAQRLWWLLRILLNGTYACRGGEEVPRAYALPPTHLIYPARSAVFLKSPLMVRGESACKGAREVKKVTYMYEQHINRTYPKYPLTPLL